MLVSKIIYSYFYFWKCLVLFGPVSQEFLLFDCFDRSIIECLTHGYFGSCVFYWHSTDGTIAVSTRTMEGTASRVRRTLRRYYVDASLTCHGCGSRIQEDDGMDRRDAGPIRYDPRCCDRYDLCHRISSLDDQFGRWSFRCKHLLRRASMVGYVTGRKALIKKKRKQDAMTESADSNNFSPREIVFRWYKLIFLKVWRKAHDAMGKKQGEQNTKVTYRCLSQVALWDETPWKFDYTSKSSNLYQRKGGLSFGNQQKSLLARSMNCYMYISLHTTASALLSTLGKQSC